MVSNRTYDRAMDSVVELPDDLAAMPPGPGLAAALNVVDLSAVPNDRMLDVLTAQHRQLCHEQARMAAVLAELGRCATPTRAGRVARLDAMDRYAPDETRAALRWTRRAADVEHDTAETVVHAMPALFDAWLAGTVDRSRVLVFHRYLADLTPAQVTAICTRAVPRAPRLTTGQLAALLRRMVLAVDPAAAERWYRKGVRDRNVVAVMDPDGTVTMSADGLPADEAEAACTRLEGLADAAKRAGHPGAIGQIRCDLFLGMLDGRFHGLTTGQIITALIAQHHPDGAATGARRPSAATGRPASGDARVGIEIRAALSTLLGRDEHPGEIPGLGPLGAPATRARIALQRRAQWRFAVTDSTGRLLSEGITRHRPATIAGHPVRRDGPPDGIVEIHTSAELLHELAATGSGEWAAVIADVAEQHRRRDQHLADLDAHPARRFPTAALRRHTQIRDRTCVFPGCRRRAAASQQDHTREHARGGTTVTANTAPACGHDHDVKHGGGWRLDQPEPGKFLWHSPLGGRYRTHGEFLLPELPDPHPVDLGPDVDRPTRQVDGPILQPRRPPDPPRPPPRRPDLPDDPPF